MTVEKTIYDTLKGLVADQVYPDVAPPTVAKPYIVFQQVGGLAVNFLDQSTIPSKKRSRFQVACWGDTRKAVAALAAQIEDALRAVTALQTTVEGAAVAIYEPDTALYGSLQDFSFIS